MDLFAARDLVLKVIAKNNSPCGLVLPRTDATSVEADPAGWLVSVDAISGKAKGWSTWVAAAGKVTPKNANAELIVGGCAGAHGPSVPDVSGAWLGDGGPHFQLKASAKDHATLDATWTGGPGHEGLKGSVHAKLGGSDYSGPMTIDEGSVHVTGTMTFSVVSASKIAVSYTQSNGVEGKLTLKRTG